MIDYLEIEEYVADRLSAEIICATSGHYKLIHNPIHHAYSVYHKDDINYIFSSEDCQDAVEAFELHTRTDK